MAAVILATELRYINDCDQCVCVGWGEGGECGYCIATSCLCIRTWVTEKNRPIYFTAVKSAQRNTVRGTALEIQK